MVITWQACIDEPMMQISTCWDRMKEQIKKKELHEFKHFIISAGQIDVA